MREIKFRAWDNSTQKMYYKSGLTVCDNSIIHMDGFIMQFTGLKDKNGKEIYEGDIVKIFHGHKDWIRDNFLITFQSYAFALKRPALDGSTAIATYLNDCLSNGVFIGNDDESRLFEIIGNIYQNPELLNQ